MVAASGASAATVSAAPDRSDRPARTFITRHQLSAEVSEVDAEAQALRLKTDAGRLTFHVAHGETLRLRRGDHVVVDVAIIRHPDPTTLPRLREDPAPLLARRVRGSITSIQRSVGVVWVTTSAGRLALDLPPAAIQSLHTGEELTLDLALRSESDAAALARQNANRKGGLAGLLFMIFGRPK
jgi:hypothetical protein